ncbi:MAG TPA: sigma-70 family RNA polymerase sigma factor [Solirubrobacteraceae bacterium]|nr:sigma-70 family RNA polymerase sigma factor [Solirubrobacteraceae bacterium]
MRRIRRSSRGPGDAVPQDVDDTPLVSRARDGDRAAFEELVRRHADRVYAVVIRFGVPHGEAEEIVQETFVRAWRAIARFKGESQFFTWLYRIAINEAKRHMTRRGARLERVASDESPLHAIGDPAPSPQLRAEHQDLRAALERAVRALPMDHRIPLVLRDIEGLSTAQAAAVMQLGEPAFKSRLHRARLAVREAMQDYLDVEDTP